LQRNVAPEDIVFHKRTPGPKVDGEDESESYKLGHYMSADARTREESALKAIAGACRGQKPNRGNTAAFLLPAASEGDSTTKISVKTRMVCWHRFSSRNTTWCFDQKFLTYDQERSKVTTELSLCEIVLTT